MLVREELASDAHLELVRLTAKAPDDIAGVTIDLGDLVQVPIRQQKIVVPVDFDRIAVDVIDEIVPQVDAVCGIGYRDVVPTPPLKDNIFIDI